MSLDKLFRAGNASALGEFTVLFLARNTSALGGFSRKRHRGFPAGEVDHSINFSTVYAMHMLSICALIDIKTFRESEKDKWQDCLTCLLIKITTISFSKFSKIVSAQI